LEPVALYATLMNLMNRGGEQARSPAFGEEM